MTGAVRRFLARCLAFARPGRADDEFRRELEAVRAIAEERHYRRGLTPQEAAATAHAEVGAMRLCDLHRDARSFAWLEDARSDLRYAARTLVASPGFSFLAILTLAVGIGSVTVIYSVIHNLLIDPLPYPGSHRFVNLRIEAPGGGRRDFLAPDEFMLFARAPAFDDVVGTRGQPMVLTVGDRGEAVRAVGVTPNFFHFMGLPALVGRALSPDDAAVDAPPAAVLRHRAWVAHFGADPAVVGRTILLDGQPRTVVGVMPPRFTWHAADVWVPAPITGANPRDPASGRNFQARLRTGATLAEAEAQVATLAAQRAREFPQAYPDGYRIRVSLVIDDVVGSFRGVLYTLLGAVGLLLVIACCNVANMLLAKATDRQREITVRAALGAGRGRIVRQLLTESVLLSLAGAAGGCALAYVGVELLVPHLPQGPLPGEVEFVLNRHALLVSLGLAVGSGLLFGLAPALHTARVDLGGGLRGAGKGTTGSRGNLRNMLVVFEIAMGVVLIVSAGLLTRSFVALTEVPLGFDADRLLVAMPTLPRGSYADASERRQLYRRWLGRVQSLAGVSGATVTSALPPFGGPQVEATIAGEDAAAATTVSMVRATDGYFAVLGAPLVRGRPLAEDARDEPRDVAVVNSALVRALLKQQDPVGRQIVLTMPAQPNRPASVRSFEIVGEVRDFRNRGLRVPPGPEVYLPGVSPQGASALVVRGSIEPALLTRAIGRELGAIDGRIGSTVQPWSGTLDRSYYAQPRFSLQVLGVFSVTGMLLVGLGVYSVMSYTVSRQSHDIAVRLALGARRSQVWRGVLGWAGALVAMGLTVGVAATFGTNRLLADQLWNTPRHDPATLAATAILVAVVAVLACLVPAWRAMTVDPLTVLRRD